MLALRMNSDVNLPFSAEKVTRWEMSRLLKYFWMHYLTRSTGTRRPAIHLQGLRGGPHILCLNQEAGLYTLSALHFASACSVYLRTRLSHRTYRTLREDSCHILNRIERRLLRIAGSTMQCRAHGAFRSPRKEVTSTLSRAAERHQLAEPRSGGLLSTTAGKLSA